MKNMYQRNYAVFFVLISGCICSQSTDTAPSDQPTATTLAHNKSPSTTLAAAVQPLVTVVLALLFLGERIGLIESVGILLAILAAVALSQESPKPVQP